MPVKDKGRGATNGRSGYVRVECKFFWTKFRDLKG